MNSVARSSIWVARITTAAHLVSLLGSAQMLTNGPIAANVSHSSARIVFTLSAPAQAPASIMWGKTVSYGALKAIKLRDTVGTVVLTGLEPQTVYHYRVTAGSATSSDQTFTTSAAKDGAPQPAVRFDLGMPAGWYSGDLRVSRDCSNIHEILSLVANLKGSANQRVVIPAGTTCTGQFVLPKRPDHSGWVVITTSGNLPAGTRVSPSDVHEMARFVTNSSPAKVRSVISSLPRAWTCRENGMGEVSSTIFPR